MRVHNSLCQGLFLLSLLLLHAVSLCSADDKTFEVVGTGECADCKENNLKTTQAFSGLSVSIDCKLKNGDMKRIGASELDEQGNFKVSLPRKLEQECYAQLHSAASSPCLEASKIIFKSQNNGKHIFVPTKNLHFSSALCTSKFFWTYFKYPPLPPLKHFGHPLPPLDKPPPVPIYKPPVVKLLPPPVPIYKPKPKPESPVVKPLHPPAPVYKPKPNPIYKPPVVKPLPPPAPIYKPEPPVVKPLPPPAPVYKPKPPVPIYKPKPPVYKPPPIPLYPIPPITKKPCPPLPKLPPLPKIPPKYFHHPKFGYFPPAIPHA